MSPFKKSFKTFPPASYPTLGDMENWEKHHVDEISEKNSENITLFILIRSLPVRKTKIFRCRIK